MLKAYSSDNPAEPSTALPAGPKPLSLVWVDLLKATAEEISVTEASLGLKVPSLASLSEIEHSSRMRWEGNAIVLSLHLPATATGGYSLLPVGFVLRGDLLATVRFDAEKQFDDFAGAFGKEDAPADRSAASILTGLFEVIVDAIADRLEGRNTRQIRRPDIPRRELEA
jgi:magnesium transporter